MMYPVFTVLLLTLTGTFAISFPWSKATPLWNDFRVRFSPLGYLAGYEQMPRTAAAAKAKGFVMPPEETVTDIEILCPKKDPAICIIFDKAGNVAGIEMALRKPDLENIEYPLGKHPLFVSKTRFGYDLYTTTLFFVEQSVLKSGGRPSLEPNGTGTGLWLQNGPSRNNLFEVPRYEKDIGKTAYTKEKCINGMGLHYYYNMTETMSCEDFFPIFGLYVKGELVGFGWQTFGKETPIVKTTFEDIPALAVKAAIKNPAPCITERLKKYGVLSLHVYFTNSPWGILCPLFS